MDTGCELEHYEGDVGRTVPVSKTFNENQRETWNMLIRAYKVGLSSMKAGASLPAVMEEARKEIENLKGSLETDYARQAAASILAAPASRNMAHPRRGSRRW